MSDDDDYLGLIRKCAFFRVLLSFVSIFTAKTVGWSIWNSTGYDRDFAMVTVWNEDGNIILTKWPEYSEDDLFKYVSTYSFTEKYK